MFVLVPPFPCRLGRSGLDSSSCQVTVQASMHTLATSGADTSPGTADWVVAELACQIELVLLCVHSACTLLVISKLLELHLFIFASV